MSAPAVDLFLTYQFLKRLATPFNQWPAFKHGIIDENGKVLRKSETLTKPEEKDSWGYFDRLVANLKKIIGTVPGGKSKIASFAAAILLIKESKTERDVTDEELEQLLVELFEKQLQEMDGQAVNAVGAGKVAGLGVGIQGEPPKKTVKQILKRKVIDVAGKPIT